MVYQALCNLASTYLPITLAPATVNFFLMSSTFLPQGLFTCNSLCLGGSSSRFSHDWLPVIQV